MKQYFQLDVQKHGSDSYNMYICVYIRNHLNKTNNLCFKMYAFTVLFYVHVHVHIHNT